MKTSAITAAMAIFVGLSWAGMAQALARTITLSVEGMTCVSCPYMVEQSLKRVEGVLDVRASMESDTAEVTFDDASVGIETLTSATVDAGFPSRVKE